VHPLAQPRGNLGFPNDPQACRRGIAPKNIATFNTHTEALEPMAGALWTGYDPSFPALWVEAMKKSSQAGGKPAKVRRRPALKPKDHSTKAIPRRGSAPAGQTEVAQLTRELKEAQEQQAATTDLLKVISQSAFNLQIVLDTLVQSAAGLCEADMASLVHPEGPVYRFLASYGYPQQLIEFMETHPVHLERGTVTGRTVIERKPVQIPDVLADPEFTFREGVKIGGMRTMLGVPLLRDGVPMGVFVLSRSAVRPFSDKQIELVQNFAAQAVIAIENTRLLNELRQRTADLTESLEQQTATSEVLQVISKSPGDIQPVLASMLENAVRICDATFGNIYSWDGEALHMLASHNTPPAFAEDRRRSPYRPYPKSPVGRMLATKRLVHISDVMAEDVYTKKLDPVAVTAVTLGGIRTLLGVPLLNKGEMIGVFFLSRQEVRPFTDKQIGLVENFAAQAVVAIENTRLLNELRQSLERQTATSEVLQVISASPGDLEPVFASVLENAVRICDAKFGSINRWDGEALHLVATHKLPPAFAEFRRRTPFRPGPENPISRMLMTKTIIHFHDLAAEQGYIERDPTFVAAVELGGVRTFLAVPMLKENELIGVVIVYRQEVRPFTDKQIDLVKNFAAQAVIAIENARLLNELRDSLQQQTATSEVLQVINSSTGDVQPVFDTMLEKAIRICDAKFGMLYRHEGGRLRLMAARDVPPMFAAAQGGPFTPAPGGMLDSVMKTGRTVHLPDLAATQAYLDRHPIMVEAVELGGVRTVVGVPMLKDAELVGIIGIYRQEVRPFTDKQVALLTNFAAQAVIAIENTRLLSELRESLQEQTATSEVLQVISNSPGDVQPVFDTMLEEAVRICDATFGNIQSWDGEIFQVVATHNTPPALVTFLTGESRMVEARKRLPVRPVSAAALGRLVASKRVVHIDDLAAEPSYIEHRLPAAVAAVERGGVRTALLVPMLKENEVVGAFTLNRPEVRPFTEKQIALVTNFAAQAVIAIENTRLLNELRRRTEEVEKLNQHLEQRVTDQVGEIERMGRLRRFLPPQVADLIVASGTEKQLESHRREITALFCDLRGFTGFSESADPEDVMALLREYHAAIGEIIIKYSGTLERYAGDGVMVVFNDPVPVPKPALQAVQAALDMRAAIGALTEKWSRLGHDLGFGVGIAHGHATLGTIGFEGRFDYAAIGTVSNVASRLCDEAKAGQILISPRVLMAVEDAVTVEAVGEFELKGIRRPIAAYNVLATAPPNA
jgi:GAF domain-containing protein